jgi:hypothetical protein
MTMSCSWPSGSAGGFMPERTKPRRDGPARLGSFGGTGDTGDAWVCVRREISHVARETSEQIQHRWFDRAGALLRYHARESLNPAYRELLDEAGVGELLDEAGVGELLDEAGMGELLDHAGVDTAAAGRTAATWSRVPIIDKQWLARADYHRQPACPGPVSSGGRPPSRRTPSRDHRGSCSRSPGRQPPCAPRSCCTAGRPWRTPTPAGCGRASPRHGSLPSIRRPRRGPWVSRPPTMACTACSPRRTSSR